MPDLGQPRARILLLSLTLCAGCARVHRGDIDVPAGDTEVGDAREAANVLTAQEEAAGFVLLFDGTSLERWRGFRRADVPGGWSASAGTLAYVAGIEGGDLITKETYGEFDLRLEWKIGPGGNSGIFFGVTEDAERAYESGPEMQVLDNAGHPDGQSPLTSAGANFGLHAPSADVTRPIGAWNEARIVRRGDHIEHWLNGVRIVEYEIGTAEWRAGVLETKFAQWPGYGVYAEGHIGLQDHGAPVWFRNLRIRRL